MGDNHMSIRKPFSVAMSAKHNLWNLDYQGLFIVHGKWHKHPLKVIEICLYLVSYVPLMGNELEFV